jgi:hypothetical protein
VGASGTFPIPVTICGNSTVDSIIWSGGVSSDRVFAVTLTPIEVPANSGLPACGRCRAFVTIVNDDGPPAISINRISVSEPIINTKVATFTVSLHHPSTQPVSVNFATRNGTAKARCITCAVFDYEPRSGTLTIPASSASTTNLTATIGVTIVSDSITEPDETFFVDLSAPVNGTIASGFGTGIATIRDGTLSLGGFEVSPADAEAFVGETLHYYVDWTVPEGRVWRDLRSIDFRIRRGSTALWVRWDESSNLISLCRRIKKDDRGHDDPDDDGPGPGVDCTEGGLPGSATVLATDYAQLRLAESRVVGSGPTGRDVTLDLAVEFLGEADGDWYHVELAAADDVGGVDQFVRAAEVRVEKSKGRARH